MLSTDRPMRAHARRNRDELLAAARRALAATDSDGAVSLEGIARDAGVGIGTLYRHFPTRQALFEAVYGSQLDDLTAGADELLAAHPPAIALREWIGAYADFARTKRGVHETLKAGMAAGRLNPSTTRARINAAVEPLLSAGAADATLRKDITADDVTTMLVGIFLATATSPDGEQTTRLLDLLMAALRP
ncbi:TetR/AcrR family transcriptional regulator [Cellulomonas sp. JH27-2]|uniref:TetR/AcrR family transcriptional regulator n=1 Tax=Cellulomonas sp. JH27-2 TaxID=2774139 RepID=UPI00351AFA03